MLLMKEEIYFKLIIELYKISNYNKEKAKLISKITITKLIEYGFDPQYKYKLLSDLNLSTEDLENTNTTLELTPLEEPLINSIIFETMLHGYRS